MKRVVSATLLLLLLFSLFACNTPAAVPSPSPTPEQSASPSESVTVTPATADSPAPEQSPTAEPSPSTAPYEITRENFPRLDGSTACIPLGEALAATMLGISREEAGEYSVFTKTSDSIYALIARNADLIIVYDPPEDLLDIFGDRMIMMPIGLDALVFLVNSANPVSNLTSRQIVDIYTGKITNWKTVGGDNAEILPFQRNESSGSQAWFRKLVIGDAALAPAPVDLLYSSMSGLVAAVASYDNGPRAIGYNMYFYVTMMKADPNIKILTVDGVEPSNETIRSGEYPYVGQFYAAIRADEPETSLTYAIFEWLQGEQGAVLLEHEGYVPLYSGG